MAEPNGKPKKLSMGDMLNDPKLQPPRRPLAQRTYIPGGLNADDWMGTGMSEEDLLGYTPGDQD